MTPDRKISAKAERERESRVMRGNLWRCIQGECVLCLLLTMARGYALNFFPEGVSYLDMLCLGMDYGQTFPVPLVACAPFVIIFFFSLKCQQKKWNAAHEQFPVLNETKKKCHYQWWVHEFVNNLTAYEWRFSFVTDHGQVFFEKVLHTQPMNNIWKSIITPTLRRMFLYTV